MASILSIIIVNYNGEKYLKDCIESVLKFAPGSTEVIVVDNASTDESHEVLSRYQEHLSLIYSKVNLGFAGGNNLGAEHATGDFILLLNNDTILKSKLQPSIDLLEKNSSIGVVGARMLDSNGITRVSTGRFPSLHRLIRFSHLWDYKTGKSEDSVVETDWVEGSFLLTRKSLWDKLSGLDTDYFMYVEDVDYCKRATKLGFRVVFFSELEFVHFGGYGDSRLGLLVAGFRKYHTKHSNLFIASGARLILTMGLLIRWILGSVAYAAFRNNAARARGRACWQALKESPW